MSNYNERFEQVKGLLPFVREEFIFASPLHNRLSKKNIDITLHFIAQCLSNRFHFIANHLSNNLDSQPQSNSNVSKTLEKQYNESEFDINWASVDGNDVTKEEFGKLFDEFFNKIDVDEDLLTVIGSIGFNELFKNENYESWLETWTDSLLEISPSGISAIDFTLSSDNTLNIAHFSNKVKFDTVYLLLKCLQELTLNDKNDLAELAILTSIFNLYMVRNYFEVVENRTIDSEEISKYLDFIDELELQWQAYNDGVSIYKSL